jgi:hypothetical protein
MSGTTLNATGGGGGSAELYAAKSADVALTASSTTLQSDADMHLSLSANSTYEFSGVINYNGTTNNTSVKVALLVSTTFTSMRFSASQGGTAVTPSSVTASGVAVGNFPITNGTQSDNLSIFFSGVIVTNSNAPTITIQEADGTNNANPCSILTNSFIRAVKVQ